MALPWNTPTTPECFDLDEFIQQAGEKIHELYEKTQLLPEADSQLAKNIQKIQLPPEGSAPGHHPTVEVTYMDQKKGECT